MRTFSPTRIFAFLLGTLSLAEPASAASDPPIALAWTAPNRADCPDAAYVLGEIERYVGADGSRPDKAIQAKATVRGVGLARWQLLLQTTHDGVDGERVFEDESCRAVADAAVVVLAWMIDPDAMANRSSPPPRTTVPPRAPASKPVRVSEPRTVHSFMALGAVGDVGTLPWPALGVELQGGTAWKRLRLASGVACWPSRSKATDTLADGVAVGAHFSLATFGLVACLDAIPARLARRLQLSSCAGPELDWIHGAGFGVSDPSTGGKAWLALRSGLEARWVFSPPMTDERRSRSRLAPRPPSLP